ncbi:MAG TPA: D-alanine--D-alanine ligase family protein [Solirubrobacteraceae bacterium]|jgi:D-alanine-D-alanine ligase
MSGPEALTVVLLAGGRSSEHDVSLASAEAVRSGLRQAGHTVRWVLIERDGTWSCEGARLSLCPGAGLLEADVVFPVLHGPFGEDGAVQGALETLGAAYVGAGVAASALCMDKVLFKELMAAAGVPQVDFVGVREERWRHAPEEVLAEVARLGLPVFVKPAHLGSSVGIVKVSEGEALGGALAQAFAHDPLVIVEALAPGAEVEVAVLGLPSAERLSVAGRSNGSHPVAPGALASEPGEIVFAGDWYDYEAKYAKGGMELVMPARISVSAAGRVRELALEVFSYTGCEGLARVDFFVEGESVLVNELNTMPGFTPTSVYARLIEAAGIAYPELVDRLCRLALERYERRRAHSY